MSTPEEQLRLWAEKGESLAAQTWEQMPDIYLYMDQVITCLQGMLEFYDIDGKMPLITNSMINNYVKNGAVERPIKKKYNRTHLSRLYMICLLKQVLTMQEIDRLLKGGSDPQALFEQFADIISEATRTESSRVLEASQAEESNEALWQLAMQLSAEAAAKQAAARKIIQSIARRDPSQPNG